MGRLSPVNPPTGADKPTWRTWAADQARTVDSEALSVRIVRHLGAWLPPHVGLLLFAAMPGEPDLSGLAHGGPLFLTRTPEQGPLTLHDARAPRERHRWGYSQPRAGTPQRDPTDVDVALVPGVAFSSDGARLGHGKGYYDQLLAELRPDAARVGVTFDALVVPALPTAPHDVPMTHLVTETGVRAVSGPE